MRGWPTFPHAHELPRPARKPADAKRPSPSPHPPPRDEEPPGEASHWDPSPTATPTPTGLGKPNGPPSGPSHHHSVPWHLPTRGIPLEQQTQRATPTPSSTRLTLEPPSPSRSPPARTADPPRYNTVTLPTEHIPRAPVTLAPTPPVFPQQHTKGRPRTRPPRLPSATRDSVSNPHGPSRGNPLRQPNTRLALPTTS